MKNPWASKGLYPIAYIDGSLYFMSCKEHAQLNAQWGNDTMFFVRTDNPIASAKSMDLSYKPSAMLLKLAGDEFKEIHTYQLGEILQTKSNGLIDEFISYAKQNGGCLKISYQDEHLKSIMGMMTLGLTSGEDIMVPTEMTRAMPTRYAPTCHLLKCVTNG